MAFAPHSYPTPLLLSRSFDPPRKPPRRYRHVSHSCSAHAALSGPLQPCACKSSAAPPSVGRLVGHTIRFWPTLTPVCRRRLTAVRPPATNPNDTTMGGNTPFESKTWATQKQDLKADRLHLAHTISQRLRLIKKCPPELIPLGESFPHDL